MSEPSVAENREEATKRSVTRDNSFPIDRGGGYFQILIPSPMTLPGSLPAFLPPDYRVRDRVLNDTVRADAMWSAAIGIAITKAASLSWEAKSDGEIRSKRAQELLLSADATSISGIGGWVSYMGKQVRNFTCTNAGCFTEIIRKSGAYGSKIVGLGHLSSLRMRRTGDPDYPFIYLDRWGRQHVMRWWQVFNLVDMPDPDEAYLGQGLCAAERAYQQIRKLAALEQYIYEKLSGSRPLALHIVNGLTKDQLTDMMTSASDNQASKGLSLYMGAIVASTLKPDSPPSLVTIPLAELPDGFDAAQERERADLIYANSLGLDPQDLRPMSNQQMGAGAQSEVLNQKAEGRGQAAYRQQLTHMLNQLVFDDKTQFLFTEHDYRDQQAAANVSVARATFLNTLVQGQIVTPPQAMQVLVEQGELPKAFIEEGAQAGSDLSDTDKPDVNDPLNDASGPPQPENQPVMQTQTPVAPAQPTAPQSPGVPPLVPKKTSTIAQPQAVLQQKTVPGHNVRHRSVQRAAHRILRNLTQKGAIHVKADSAGAGGVWRMIHGHPVLIKGGGGGGSGGSGGGTGGSTGGSNGKTKKGPKAGVLTGVGTATEGTPKPQKKNVPTHGAGGASKYPTLDAYKKGQISHDDALKLLKADIQTAKLSGDTKAVNTLNTQYYGLKKAGPKPTAATPVKGQSPDVVKPVNVPNPSGKPLADLTGSSMHMHAEGLKTQIDQGAASFSDVNSFHMKANSEIAQLNSKIDGADAAIASAKAAGMTPLPAIVKMKQDAIDQQNALHALKADVDAKWNNTPTKFTKPPSASVPAAKVSHTDPDVVKAAGLMANNEWLGYDKLAKDIATKHGMQVNTVKDLIAKAHQENLHVAPAPTFGSQHVGTGGGSGSGPSLQSVAQQYGIQPAHLQGAQSLIAKHNQGLIADATYKTQMYKITKNAGVSKSQLENAAAELGSAHTATGSGGKAPKMPKPVTGGVPSHIAKAQELDAQFKSGHITVAEYNDKMGALAEANGLGPKEQLGSVWKLQAEMNKHTAVPAATLQKTPNPLSSLKDEVAAKVAAMPLAKQDLIKLGAVYDTHGGTSSEYTAAIAAYNAKHGTTLNWSSAGPAVKTAKQEAGMLPSATKTGSGAIPTPGHSYSDAVNQAAKAHGVSSSITQQAAIAQHQYVSGLISNEKYEKKLNELSGLSGHPKTNLVNAANTALMNDPKLKDYALTVDLGMTKKLNGKEFNVVNGIGASNTWGNKHYAGWRKTLTSGEEEAFIGYSKHGDGPINNFLRKGELGDESGYGPQRPSTVKKRIKHLDDAIAKTSIPEDVVAVRGFSHSGFAKLMAEGKDLNGAVFHDNAFVSTSVNSQGGFSGSIKMRIHIPKGSKGAYMDGDMKLTKFPGEAEILLGRDSNFRITGYSRKSPHSPWEVDVEYIGAGPMPVTGTAFKAQ